MALSFRAFTLRLLKFDKFNGRPIVTFHEGISEQKAHLLSSEQMRWQENVQHQWDPQWEEMTKNAPNMSVTESEELQTHILKARLAAVHIECTNASYGELGMDDRAVRVYENLDTYNDSAPAVKECRNLENKRKMFMDSLRGGKWRSNRIEILVGLVQSHLSDPSRPGKILIFSEFLTALDVVEVAMSEINQPVLRFDATVNDALRRSVIEAFYNDNEKNILLITNCSGGPGLNLTPADCIIHLTPSWNPTLESQCTDRAIRAGQTQQVYVYHFHSPNSIEELVCAAQAEKRQKASKLLDPDTSMLHAMDSIKGWSEEEFRAAVSLVRAPMKTLAHTCILLGGHLVQ